MKDDSTGKHTIHVVFILCSVALTMRSSSIQSIGPVIAARAVLSIVLPLIFSV